MGLPFYKDREQSWPRLSLPMLLLTLGALNERNMQVCTRLVALRVLVELASTRNFSANLPCLRLPGKTITVFISLLSEHLRWATGRIRSDLRAPPLAAWAGSRWGQRWAGACSEQP